MRDDICSIPVTEIFEKNCGCPICRMRDIVEERLIDYIMGAAMMEPDVRTETNATGFCSHHYSMMLNKKGKLQLALMLKTHLDQIKVYSKKNEISELKRITNSCFICDKINWSISRMLKTVTILFENEPDFRKMFNNQSELCLTHYVLLKEFATKKRMRNTYKDFKLSIDYLFIHNTDTLLNDITSFCEMFDYRSDKNKIFKKDALERIAAFLSDDIK